MYARMIMYVCALIIPFVQFHLTAALPPPPLLLGNDRKNSKEMKGPLASATSAADG